MKKPTIKLLSEIFDNILKEEPYINEYNAAQNINEDEYVVLLALITNMMKYKDCINEDSE